MLVLLGCSLWNKQWNFIFKSKFLFCSNKNEQIFQKWKIFTLFTWVILLCFHFLNAFEQQMKDFTFPATFSWSAGISSLYYLKPFFLLSIVADIKKICTNPLLSSACISVCIFNVEAWNNSALSRLAQKSQKVGNQKGIFFLSWKAFVQAPFKHNAWK